MKRPKLSLETHRQIRGRPPTAFPQPGEEGRTAKIGKEARPANHRPAGRPPQGSAASDTATARPRPRPATASGNAREATDPRRRKLDRALVIKALLAAGVTAVSIVLLKRRLF
jgi:hypothetical protein